MNNEVIVPEVGQKYRATKECGPYKPGDVLEVVSWSPFSGRPQDGFANGLVRLRQPDGDVKEWGACGLGTNFLAAELLPKEVPMSKIDVYRAQITAAIREARAMGIGVVRGTFGLYEPGECCCPMAAVAACDTTMDRVRMAAEKLGWDKMEVWAFVRAFDHGEAPKGVAGELGREFRQRLVLA